MSAPADEAATQSLERVPEALSTRESWLDPFGWYAEMREDDPVTFDASRQCWDVFRYADVDRILDDPETFASDPQLASSIDLPLPDQQSPVMETMLLADGERHGRLRGVVEEWFRPRTLAGRADRFETIAADLLEDAVAGGEMDLIDDFAYPFPVIVIAELLGVPSEDRPQFREWSATLVETPTAEDDIEAVQQRPPRNCPGTSRRTRRPERRPARRPHLGHRGRRTGRRPLARGGARLLYAVARRRQHHYDEPSRQRLAVSHRPPRGDGTAGSRGHPNHECHRRGVALPVSRPSARTYRNRTSRTRGPRDSRG